MDDERVIMVLAILCINVLVRPIILKVIAAEQIDSLCRRLFGRRAPEYLFRKDMLAAGWDFGIVGIGLMVFAMVNDGSEFWRLVQSCREKQFLVSAAIFLFGVIVPYLLAMLIRYRMIEAAQLQPWRAFRSVSNLGTGGALWIIGLFLLVTALGMQ